MYEKLTEKGDLLNDRINYFANLLAPKIMEMREAGATEEGGLTVFSIRLY